jgi:glucoamylase
MPRSVVLGNGNMLVNMDRRALIHDFYFPHVGLEDHTTFGHLHRIGIFEEDSSAFTWLTDDHWTASNRYRKETLICETTLRSDLWQLELQFTDCIHPIDNILCRQIKVINRLGKTRKLRFFFNFDFHMYGVKGNDTVYYYPKENYLIFYKYNRYFLLNGESKEQGIAQYATGKSEFKGLEGTWKDAEDGLLSGHPIEQGSVDATFALHTTVDDNSETELKIWVCAGRNENEVKMLNYKVFKIKIEELIDYTQNYWHSWINKQNFNFEGMDEDIIQLFKQSLLIIRSQIDRGGAIIAANDTDIMKFNKDTYSYMWPRDGALIVHALDNTGYSEISKKFLSFCKKVQTEDGYMLPKYNPDGSVGSTWHPWQMDKPNQIPIQEDETALPLIALWNHYQRLHDIEFLQTMTETLVIKAAEFLIRYKDPKTNLPLPSYDLWEEQVGIFTWTCSTVYKGLVSAAELMNVIGHDRHFKRYMNEANLVKEAILKYLYDEKEKTFVKKITQSKDGSFTKDLKADASIAGIFLFDVLPADDERVVNTMKRIKKKLEVKTEIGGLARYENDKYQSISNDYPPEVPGNPWIITTLWYAQWLLAIAKNEKSKEFKEAEQMIKWVTKQAYTTFILPEQINPFTGEHLSVAPLTWSHSTYVDTVMFYRMKLTEFGVCKEHLIPETLNVDT